MWGGMKEKSFRCIQCCPAAFEEGIFLGGGLAWVQHIPALDSPNPIEFFFKTAIKLFLLNIQNVCNNITLPKVTVRRIFDS